MNPVTDDLTLPDVVYLLDTWGDDSARVTDITNGLRRTIERLASDLAFVRALDDGSIVAGYPEATAAFDRMYHVLRDEHPGAAV